MNGAELIAMERNRQVEEEGWKPEHDDEHSDGSLGIAGACYALQGSKLKHWPTDSLIQDLWPWASKWWKPASPIRMLVKAGALIAAEIDRRLRAGEEM